MQTTRRRLIVPAPTTSRRARHDDIEGLRALAIVLVLLYHAGLPVTGGFVGVDVFFVLSGFLITGLLVRELEQTGRISLSRFWARRARRLLPAAALVLVATAALTWLTAAVVDRRTFGLDIASAAGYVVNWRLAARSVDYLAEGTGVSPVQHYWSLAVEEQFYVLWPLLVLLVGWWWHRRARRTGPRGVLTVAILAVVLPSFAWSVQQTATSPATAFFVTPTRLWELGVGALLAIGAAWWPRLPRAAAGVLGWAGLGAILAAAVVIDGSTAWPGSWALLPVLGTAAVIVAGHVEGVGPARVLSWGPAVAVGGLSYSLYLWHWPLLVAAAALWGGLSPVQGLAVVAVSALPAWACHRWVENPVRFSPALARSGRATLAMAVVCTLVGVAAGAALVMSTPAASAGADGRQPAGAAALADPAASGGDGTPASLDDVTWFTPDPAAAPDDVPDAYDRGCQADQRSSEVVTCSYGDEDAETVVAVVGDSKILQWESALEQIAEQQGWRVVSMTKSSCAFSATTQPLQGERYESCADWNDAVARAVLDLRPDVVLTSQDAETAYPAGEEGAGAEPTTQAMQDGLVTRWSALAEAGIDVVPVLDMPNPSFEVYSCAAEYPRELATCAFDREEGVAESAAPVQLAAAARVPGTEVVDLRDVVCPADACVPVIGNTLVWRQGSHVTDTYVRTMVDEVAEQVVPAVQRARR